MFTDVIFCVSSKHEASGLDYVFCGLGKVRSEDMRAGGTPVLIRILTLKPLVISSTSLSLGRSFSVAN